MQLHIFNCSIKESKKPLEVESAHDAWEDLTTVADNTMYPDSVLIASGIASVNNLAFVGTLPSSKDKPNTIIAADDKGNDLIYLCYL